MTYTTIQQFNATGLDGIFVYLANEVPVFTSGIIVVIYLIVTMSIYLGSKKSGTGDFWAASAAGSLLASIIGTVFTFTFGLINLPVLSLSVAFTILSFIMLMAKRERD